MAKNNTQDQNPISQIEPKDGFDPTDYIDPNDFFPKTPDSMPANSYYPTAEVNPVVSQQMPGRYFASMPVVSGGDVMFPQAAHDARVKAIENAAYRKQLSMKKEKENFMNQYKRELGPPQYQAVLDKKYGDELMSDYRKLFTDHSASEANAIASNVNHPWTKQFLQKYWEYDTQARLLNNIEQNVDDIDKERRTKGEQYSTATTNALNEYHSGNFGNDNGKLDLKKLSTLATAIPTYKTLDQLGIDDNIKQSLSIDEELHNGVMIDGKNVTAKSGETFLTNVKKTKLTKDWEDKWVAYLKTLPQVLPEMKANDEVLRNYVRTMGGEKIENEVIHWSVPRASDYDRRAADEAATANERYELLMSGYGGDKSVLRPSVNSPYKDGTITDARIIPVGQKVILQGTGGKVITATEPVLLIEYRDAKGRLKQDEIHDKKQIIQLNNKFLNVNKEGTSGFINPEEIDKLYDNDPRNKVSAPTKSNTDINSLRKKYNY